MFMSVRYSWFIEIIKALICAFKDLTINNKPLFLSFKVFSSLIDMNSFSNKGLAYITVLLYNSCPHMKDHGWLHFFDETSAEKFSSLFLNLKISTNFSTKPKSVDESPSLKPSSFFLLIAVHSFNTFLFGLLLNANSWRTAFNFYFTSCLLKNMSTNM